MTFFDLIKRVPVFTKLRRRDWPVEQFVVKSDRAMGGAEAPDGRDFSVLNFSDCHSQKMMDDWETA